MRLILFGVSTALLAGCSTVPAQPGESQLADLAAAPIAVSYQLVAKRINYSEVLYRVLWLENTSSARDFSGLWAADEDLTVYVAARMTRLGFQATSAYQLARRESVTAYSDATALAAVRDSAFLRSTDSPQAAIPPAMFFEKTLRTPEFGTLAQELRAKGYRYLAEFTSMDLAASAPGLGVVVVAAAPNLRVVDLHNGRVLWSQNLVHAEPYQLGGDLRKLEADGMRKTKEALQAGIERIDFINLWGVRPATSR